MVTRTTWRARRCSTSSRAPARWGWRHCPAAPPARPSWSTDAPARIVARDARRPGPGTPHGLLFLDPPYGRALGEAALPALAQAGWIAPGALVVWEEAAPPVPPPGWTPLEARRYGDTTVTMLRVPDA